MNRIDKLPPAFQRYRKMLGVLDFAVFDRVTGSEDEILAAISLTLGESHIFDGERLRSLGGICIREPELFGDWYDLDSGNLLRLGDYRTKGGV